MFFTQERRPPSPWPLPPALMSSGGGTRASELKPHQREEPARRRKNFCLPLGHLVTRSDLFSRDMRLRSSSYWDMDKEKGTRLAIIFTIMTISMTCNMNFKGILKKKWQKENWDKKIQEKRQVGLIETMLNYKKKCWYFTSRDTVMLWK